MGIENYNREYFTHKHERFLACGHYIPYGTFPLWRYNGYPCMLHLPLGSMPHGQVLRAIELFGTQVAPKIRTYFAMKEEL